MLIDALVDFEEIDVHLVFVVFLLLLDLVSLAILPFQCLYSACVLPGDVFGHFLPEDEIRGSLEEVYHQSAGWGHYLCVIPVGQMLNKFLLNHTAIVVDLLHKEQRRAHCCLLLIVHVLTPQCFV